METNYFEKDTQAIKHAILNIEEPVNMHPANNGLTFKAYNQKGLQIWEINFINDTMGWSIGVYTNNLKINN